MSKTPHAGRTWLRTDIEGLRAVAVLLVVLGHAGVGGLAGGYVGVDVFFVISGFVITSGLLREYRASGTINLPAFYARRSVRLLPAAVPVLLLTLVATWFWLPVRASRIAADVFACATYLINFRLASLGTDYFDTSEVPSPVQHFWSLAVEEQFYLVWPLLLLGLLWLSRWAPTWRPRRWLGGGIGLVAAASLTASVVQSQHQLTWAYFGSHTRAWELAVGALLAVRATAVPVRLRGPLAGLGLLGIIVAAVAFDEHTIFPGYAALLPVLGTAAVLAAGHANASTGTGRLLALPPLQVLGRLSYSWYLWHWPALVFGAALLGRQLGTGEQVGLCAGALAVAAASHHWLENPVRHLQWLRRSPQRGLRLASALSGVTAMVAVAAVSITPSVAGTRYQQDLRSKLAAGTAPAAAQLELAKALVRSALAPTVPANITPSLANAANDVPSFYGDGCQSSYAADHPAQHCVYGDRSAKTTVVLFGDSHAGHWFPALDPIAQVRHWRLVVFVHNACTAAMVTNFSTVLHRLNPECDTWRRAALAGIDALKPSLVVTASTGAYSSAANGGPDSDRVWVDGWTNTLRQLRRSSPHVAVINTIPRPQRDLFDCLAKHLNNAGPCQQPTATAQPDPTRRAAIARALTHGGAKLIEPTPWLCARLLCPPVVDNALVYRDTSHLTTVYAAVLAPVLQQQLEQILPTDQPH